MGDYDRSSKWLIQHHGDAILRLTGVEDVVAWEPLQAEVVQPAQLPDGLLQVRRAGAEEPELYLLEIATYPEERLRRQLLRDTLLVQLDREVLPEVVAVVLSARGNLQAARGASLRSPRGGTELEVRWRVVEMWTLPAEELLATGDAGLMPWVPLTSFTGPPETVLRRVRETIDRGAPEDERATLLAVTQVLTRLRYNEPQLLRILGGHRIMIESPLLDELRAEWTAEARAEARAEAWAQAWAEARIEERCNVLLVILRERFGAVPEEVEVALRAVRDADRLDALVTTALRCGSVEAFRAALD